MKSYELVCGAAFEDLSQDEMMKLEGGLVVIATTWVCVGVSIIVSVALSVAVA